MQMLSEDDLDLVGLTQEELERAWDLWFDLAQTTNDADPPYCHGVLAGLERIDRAAADGPPAAGNAPPEAAPDDHRRAGRDGRG